MKAKSAFPTEIRTNTHVWTEQMDRYHALRRKSARAFFKVSRSRDKSEQLMELLDDILKEDMDVDDTEGHMSFGPLPAHFSGANGHSTPKVLDPIKIVTKGAPRSNKRWKPIHEYWRTK